ELLISIAGGKSLTLYEVDEAANRVKREVDPEANIIVGATVDEEIGDRIRVSIVASGMSRMRYGAAAEWGGTTAGYADQAHDGWRAGTVASRQDDVEQFEPEGNPGPMPPPLPEWPDPDQSEADRDRQDDLAAALSEALGRPESEWQSTKGVTIKEALPDFGAGEDNPPDHNAARPPQPERGAAGFVPRLTEAPRRHVPRVPEVEDFPLVAQREYHAKRGHAPQSGASGGEPVQGRPAPERRPTLFERITGVRRRPVDSHDERKTPANGVSDDGRDVDKRGYGNSGRDPYRDGQAPHSQGVFRGKGRR
ncbi:MAG: Cell division protein FtsZ 1, partial [Pseudomonadota bacterium]